MPEERCNQHCCEQLPCQNSAIKQDTSRRLARGVPPRQPNPTVKTPLRSSGRGSPCNKTYAQRLLGRQPRMADALLPLPNQRGADLTTKLNLPVQGRVHKPQCPPHDSQQPKVQNPQSPIQSLATLHGLLMVYRNACPRMFRKSGSPAGNGLGGRAFCMKKPSRHAQPYTNLIAGFNEIAFLDLVVYKHRYLKLFLVSISEVDFFSLENISKLVTFSN